MLRLLIAFFTITIGLSHVNGQTFCIVTHCGWETTQCVLDPKCWEVLTCLQVIKSSKKSSNEAIESSIAATLCHVMLRYVTLRCSLLRYVTLCYVMLRCGTEREGTGRSGAERNTTRWEGRRGRKGRGRGVIKWPTAPARRDPRPLTIKFQALNTL